MTTFINEHPELIYIISNNLLETYGMYGGILTNIIGKLSDTPYSPPYLYFTDINKNIHPVKYFNGTDNSIYLLSDDIPLIDLTFEGCQEMELQDGSVNISFTGIFNRSNQNSINFITGCKLN
jgi:hypothetical protein